MPKSEVFEGVQFTSVCYLVVGPETIWTAVHRAFEGTSPMRFFGIRFLAVWVFPTALTGFVIELLLVNPLNGVKPWG